MPFPQHFPTSTELNWAHPSGQSGRQRPISQEGSRNPAMKKFGVQDSVPLPVNFVEVVYVEKGVGQHHVHIYSHNVVTSDLSKAERLC